MSERARRSARADHGEGSRDAGAAPVLPFRRRADVDRELRQIASREHDIDELIERGEEILDQIERDLGYRPWSPP